MEIIDFDGNDRWSSSSSPRVVVTGHTMQTLGGWLDAVRRSRLPFAAGKATRYSV
tara:strand:- start:670748 stop:670912 length:165 start_codon:yes stop_codon:yes gene_type:complete